MVNPFPKEQNNPLGKGLGLGLGLRHCHADAILSGQANVDWFEAISENYLDSGGRSLHILRQIAERYPIACHGVSLSIGSSDPLDFNYLKKLKQLAKEINPRWISDHLCWTGVMGVNSHDLLPLPLNEATLQHVIKRVITVQDYLGQQLVLENPSTYLQFRKSSISEPDFLSHLTSATGCGLLLDVNNVFVTTFNAGIDPLDYLTAFPFEAVVQMHLAGFEDCGTHLIDTHDQPVHAEVWQLFQHCWTKTNGASTCLEWDGNIPDLQTCEAEILKAKNYIHQGSSLSIAPLVNTAALEKNNIDPTDPNLISPVTPKEQPATQSLSTPINFLLPEVMSNTFGEIV